MVACVWRPHLVAGPLVLVGYELLAAHRMLQVLLALRLPVLVWLLVWRLHPLRHLCYHVGAMVQYLMPVPVMSHFASLVCVVPTSSAFCFWLWTAPMVAFLPGAMVARWRLAVGRRVAALRMQKLLAALLVVGCDIGTGAMRGLVGKAVALGLLGAEPAAACGMLAAGSVLLLPGLAPRLGKLLVLGCAAGIGLAWVCAVLAGFFVAC